MRNFFVLMLCFFCKLIAMSAQGNARDILWITGPSPSSPSSWTKAKFQAQAANYKFNAVNIFPYEFSPLSNSVPNWAGELNTRLSNQNNSDVLGIGHDAGGLVLRYMSQLQSSANLSAMILDGTPNQGGEIFRKLTRDPQSPSLESEAQRLVKDALAYRTLAQNCNGCQTINRTQDFVSQFALSNVSEYYRNNLMPGSPTIEGLQTPTIPYAVIWGNETEDMPLTRLMSSWGNAGVTGADNGFVDCLSNELIQRYVTADQKFVVSTLRVIAQLSGAISKLKATQPQSAAGVIESLLNAAANQLQATFDLLNEHREIVECELVHVALNARWNLMLGSYQVKTESVEVPNCSVFLNCEDCWNQYSIDGDDQVLGYCLSVCGQEECDGTTIVTNSYLVPEPSDVLLTKTEQLLTGAEKTYEAVGCNHLQEPFWEYAPIRDAFTDLFNGGAGAAFVVPKN